MIFSKTSSAASDVDSVSSNNDMRKSLSQMIFLEVVNIIVIEGYVGFFLADFFFGNDVSEIGEFYSFLGFLFFL